MNYAEREHAKVLRDEVTEDPFFKHFNAFHTYISYNPHRPGSSYYPPQANKKGGPGFPGEARRKCKYNREEHRWRCMVPIRRCAAQLWQFCVGCAELCVVPKAEVDRAARMQHDPMMGRKNVSGGASKNN